MEGKSSLKNFWELLGNIFPTSVKLCMYSCVLLAVNDSHFATPQIYFNNIVKKKTQMMPGLIQKQQMWKIYVHIMQLFTNVRHKKEARHS